jgi:hypothetical protein
VEALRVARRPGYKRVARFWVMSAKQEATRARRFQVLLDACARGGPSLLERDRRARRKKR